MEATVLPIAGVNTNSTNAKDNAENLNSSSEVVIDEKPPSFESSDAEKPSSEPKEVAKECLTLEDCGDENKNPVPAVKEQTPCEPQNEEVEDGLGGAILELIDELPECESGCETLEADDDRAEVKCDLKSQIKTEGDCLEDIETPSRRSHSPSDSIGSHDSSLQHSICSIASADGLNQRQKMDDKQAKKRRYNSSSDEDEQRENYAELLTTMLAKKPRLGEPLEDYFYGKMYLINKCGISGRKAVDCLLHAIDDCSLRVSAESAQYTHPNQLFEHFKNVKSNMKYYKNDRNCRTSGHADLPTIKCNFCGKRGHVSEECYNKLKYDRKTKAKKTKPINCYNCGKPGHLGKSCRSIIKYDICGKRGHVSEACTPFDLAYRQTKAKKKNVTHCFNCGISGHTNFDCTKPKSKCDICGKLGHMTYGCRRKKNYKKTEAKISKVKNCFNCGDSGHVLLDCTNPQTYCVICDHVGHISEACTRKRNPNGIELIGELEKNEFQKSVDNLPKSRNETCLNDNEMPLPWIWS